MSDRLPDRLLRDGARTLSDNELVAVLLHSSCRGITALELASHLLESLGGLAQLATLDDDVLSHRGIGTVRAATILAAREIAARLRRAQLASKRVLDHPAAVTLRFASADQEVMGALYLDVGNRLIADRELFRGSLSRIQVEPRQTLRAALRFRAASYLVFHTHPSGDPTPSAEDRAFTQQLDRAGRLLGIRLVDHLVVGGMGSWVSMKRSGDL